MGRFFRIAVMLVALLAFTFSFAEKLSPTKLGADNRENFTANNKFPYRMPTKLHNKITTNYKLLNPCATKKDVVKLLGKPDYGYQNHGTKGLSQWKGSGWTYVLEQSKSVFSKKDRTISIYFDTQDKATSLIPVNVKNLENKKADRCS